MANKNLKVYVWQDVLTDYTSGMAVVVAGSVKEAREMLSEDISEERMASDFSTEPLELNLKVPQMFYVWGGG